MGSRDVARSAMRGWTLREKVYLAFALLFAAWTYSVWWWQTTTGEIAVIPDALRFRKPGVVVILIMQTTFTLERSEERRNGILMSWGSYRGSGRMRFMPRFLSQTADPEDEFSYLCLSKTKTECLLDGYQAALAEFQEELDFVLKVDDVTFIFPDNLEALLYPISPSEPHALGNRMCIESRRRSCFLSGGAGFVLSRAAVEILLDTWGDHCKDRYSAEGDLRSEDVSISRCLTTAGHVSLESPRDGESELFNVFEPVTTIQGRFHAWFSIYKRNAAITSYGCCSPKSVTYHYVEMPLAEMLWQCHLNMAFCPRSINDWPNHLGGYAHRPKTQEELEKVIKAIQPQMVFD
mmetsp:Transcript_14917/g.28972  ORF Transcript_14917/g.28972 Transcript_14917/m.28972 type:complete len:349 (+) Transcript_14917:99-1145(+)|eukprot:CAMPEP_0171497102 /NCGR_PEP_ID=MMETSP0958-20121227/7079_1 /TAXON_ID=87120 /ORGANISM="Aurantiochytrium limacinum, Strain ATCCMYA-1381" /LENGTH=348 /DNA_ID=CAMNT_0012031295 /DNA_START=1 /DNA_END=1047 /DNA_ORIENTATION=+